MTFKLARNLFNVVSVSLFIHSVEQMKFNTMGNLLSQLFTYVFSRKECNNLVISDI